MPKLYLNDGTTDFGPEVEKMTEPEYGHQRKWVDALKLDSIAKNIKH